MTVLGGGAVSYERGTTCRADILTETWWLSLQEPLRGPLCGRAISSPKPERHEPGCEGRGTALEATQGQNDSFFSQLPYKCYLEEVASVGD